MSEPSNSPPEPNLKRMGQFTNPYPLKQFEMVRSQIWVDPKHKALLHNLFPLGGMETFMLAGLYKNICDQLVSENLTFYTPENARRATDIITCKLTAACSAGQGRLADEPRGSHEVQQPHSDVKNVSTDVHEATSGRRGGRGRVGGNGSQGKETKTNNQKANRRKRVSGESAGGGEGKGN